MSEHRAAVTTRSRLGMRTWALLLVGLLWVTPGRAENGGVPVALQAALFKKLFAYDAALRRVEAVRVLVVHPASASAPAAQVVSAFRAAGVTARSVGSGDAAAHLADASVLYVLEGAELQELREEAARRRLLTVSGSAALVERGAVSVGIGRSAAGRPEIIIHRGRLKAEGHELSAALLRLARLIQ